MTGHSERRTYFHETDEEIAKKTVAAIENGLGVILCIGETLEQRESNLTVDVVKKQIEAHKLTPEQWRYGHFKAIRTRLTS